MTKDKVTYPEGIKLRRHATVSQIGMRARCADESRRNNPGVTRGAPTKTEQNADEKARLDAKRSGTAQAFSELVRVIRATTVLQGPQASSRSADFTPRRASRAAKALHCLFVRRATRRLRRARDRQVLAL
jgi:hypothetical protein